MLRYPIIEFQNKLYQVKRKIRESQQPILDSWKEATKSDTVLRKEGYFWFVEEIEEAEIIEFTLWKDS
jgi:hypothetical protein